MDPNATVHLHNGATIEATHPPTIRTPGQPWAYAASLPLARPESADFVVDARIRVVRGTVGVSCTNAKRSSLAGEVILHPAAEAARIEFAADPAHAAYLLIRTADTSESAVAEIHSIGSRTFSADERAAISAVATLAPMPRWSRYYGTAGESLIERARVGEYLRLTAPVRRTWIEGLSVVVYPGDQLSRALYVSGVYEPNTAIVLKRLLKTGRTFLDVGAHAGIFTMLASKYVGPSGRVVSFEPSPRERTRLEEHVAINGLTNVTIVPAAVGGRAGRATLNVAAPQYGGLNTLGDRFAYDGVERVGRLDVEVVTLDGFLEQAGLEHVDVIKLDIEGAECAALQRAAHLLGTHRPALIIEVVSSALSANHSSPRDLERVLNEAGYNIFQIDDDSAELRPAAALAGVDEQNIVALHRHSAA